MDVVVATDFVGAIEGPNHTTELACRTRDLGVHREVQLLCPGK